MRLVELSVAHDHDLDRHAVLLLHLGSGRLERARKPAGLPGRGPPGEPGAQLALLPARERGDLRGSSERRCTIASVWSTESCRCAATSARSWERMRSARSWVSDRTSRTTHGAKITPSTTTTATMPSRTSRAAPSAPVA